MLDPSLVVAIRYVLASIILFSTLSFLYVKTALIKIFMLILLGILTYPLTSMLQFLGLSLLFQVQQQLWY